MAMHYDFGLVIVQKLTNSNRDLALERIPSDHLANECGTELTGSWGYFIWTFVARSRDKGLTKIR